MARDDKEESKQLGRVRITNARLSYPALFKPKAFGKNKEGDKKYQASFIIDPSTREGKILCERIEDAIEDVKHAKWGKKPPKLKGKICFLEGDGDDGEEFDGMMVLRSNNIKRPKVFDRSKLEVEEGDDEAPYGGCYVDGIVTIWAQDNEFGQRINGSLEAVRFRKHGEAFGAAPVSADEFDDLDDDDDDDRPKRRRNRDDDDGEDKPKRRSRDDEDEDDRPKRRSRDDDDEDDKPKRRKRDEEDEEDRPKRRKRDEEDEEDERPKRRKRDDDDDL